jgi:hypothetical protein
MQTTLVQIARRRKHYFQKDCARRLWVAKMAGVLRNFSMPKNPDIVTATDIANHVFCAESQRLADLGVKSAKQPQQQAGTTHHTRKATVERVAGSSIALGRILIFVALLALVAWAITR